MIMPVPAHGVKVISIGMLKPKRDQVVAWRGPILDRALVQMLADVYWGDLDVLLLDLPPGTGDIAISVGQRLTSAEVIVVTTPQEAAAEVAERAGTMAQMVHQRVAGVIENMSYLPCPHCGPEHRIEIFGSGGGTRVAETLSARLGYAIPCSGDPAGRAAAQRRRPGQPAGRRRPGDSGGAAPRPDRREARRSPPRPPRPPTRPLPGRPLRPCGGLGC
jgi:ATP-binding protein involved in chromosome partitioning